MDKIWYTSYPEDVPREIDLNWHRSIVSLLEDSFEKYRQQPAYANLGKALTYDEIDRLSRGFAVYLKQELRLGKGDRVALMMPNILQYPVALFGVLRAGLVAVNVNPLYTKRELQHQLKDSGAKAIVILANFAHTLEQCLAETDVKHVMVTQLGDMLSFPKSALVNFVLKYVKKMVPSWRIEGAIPLKQALSAGNPLAYTTPEINPEDLAFLQYTGGTTGISKGAMLTHRNITANVAQAKLWIGKNLVQGKEVVLTPLPLYHIFALTANCFTFIAMGGLNVLITNPRDIGGFVKEMGQWEFTSMTGVNTLFNALLNHPEFKNLNFKKLRLALGGGMAVQRPVAEKWKQVTGTPLIEAYGLTETSPAVCMNPLTLADYNGYIGLPISSTEVTIRDDAGKVLPQGEVGELCVKGPQVMKGYWNRPDETEKVFYDDQTLKTGDMAMMTEDGYVKIVDRKKDMILVSGFNVYPNEIEDVVAAHEKVLEVAAVGVPDPKSTEAVKLFVVKKDPSLTEEELKAYCKENLTGYKCPKHIAFREELPKTNVGKILRRALRET